MTVAFSLLVVVVVVVFLPSLVIGQQQQQPLSSRVEWDALFSLRSSLGLRSREWPRKADPCSAWAGIRCRIDGKVVGINLSGLRRTRLGRINPQFSVDALSNFTLLESFNSTGFYLPGLIPDWFGPSTLPSLTVLDLRSSSISGAVPPSLGSLTNLTHLDLSQNSLTGVLPESLSDLSRLEVLDLSRNSLTGSIPQSISSLRRLLVLNLSSNFLSGPFPFTFGSLSNLTLLDLGSNSLDGTLSGRNVFFNNLSQLQSLVLSHNSFSGALPERLWDLPKLRYLDLSYNNFTGDLVEGRNSTGFGGIAGSIFNLSHNELYGGLTLSKIDGFGFIDLSDNYFQGKVIVGAGATIVNASVVGNCLQNVSNQRSIQDCKSFYAARGLSFGDGSGIAPDTAPQSSPVQKKNNRHLKFILAGVFGGLGFIVLLVVVFILCQRRRKEGSTNQREVGVDAVSSGVGPQPPGVSINFSNLGDAFTYEQLLRATASFGDLNLIKLGHSGSLYRGLLEGGVPIVVKKIDPSTVKRDAHMVELDVFSRVSHTRLIPFLGHCLDQENEKFLVYKYMPNEDLSNALFRKTSQEEEGLQSLDWITRLKIAIGVAEALSYLHHECTPPLVHRDIQASSILLDDKFEVRLGSLSEVCAQEGDTHQNVITRFLRLSQTNEHGPSGAGTSSSATCAYDVYCLGKVLLELVTGKLGISGSNDSSTIEWLDYALPFINVYEKELVTKILDPSLIVDDDLLEEVWAMAIVAKSCLNPKPSKRPLTRYILKALENPLKVVREESTSGSARLRATSSRGSWNAALFGSWRHSSDIAQPASTNANNNTNMEREGSSRKHSLTERGGLQGSGRIGCAEVSSSYRRPSKEIFPEPPLVASPHQVSRPQEGEEEDDRR